MSTTEAPVAETLAAMTAVSLEVGGSLSPRELMIARVAALAAMDAPAASYVFNAGAAAEVGVTLDDLQSILVAVAPVVGTPRVVAAAGQLTEGLGLIVELAVSEAANEAADGKADGTAAATGG
jgi:alkylhydroperoxidase/carboxymuconolactone decarboxylase family protein YurZ